MNKARKKFIIYAELAIFVLLTVLLSVINIINFSMASEDADFLTGMIAQNHGTLNKGGKNEGVDIKNGGIRFGENRIGPMGPDSPEMNSSLRYFTYAFDNDGNSQKIEYRISAVSEEDAENWARSLINEKTGWSNMTYRFRVYKDNEKTYVTVIDQARELLPSFRILIISVIGEFAILIVSLLLLLTIGKRLFKPVEEADRKQKQFISKLENEFKMPLTVINANTEVLEKENGSTDMTKSINKQVRKMTKLVKELAALSVFEENDVSVSTTDISNILNDVIDNKKSKFEEKNLELSAEIEPGIIFKGDEEAIKKVFNELVSNSLKFAEKRVCFSLKKQNARIIVIQTNDTNLQNGNCDQVFDRFTRLDNAENTEGAGLGLSYVKDIILAHNGRVNAKVNNGIFTVGIYL